MRKNKKENQTIADAIWKFETAPYHDIKEIVNTFAHDEPVTMDGFIFYQENYVYLVYKPTDIAQHPEWKGEALQKIIPRTVFNSKENIIEMLEAQPWVYN